MIERYTLPKMREIWSDQNKFDTWLKVELAVCEAWAQLGKIPKKSLNTILKKARFNIKRIDEIEKVVDHDVIAFLTAVAENVGPDSRFIHVGLTSTDVCDTALSLMLTECMDILISDAADLIKALKQKARENKNTIMIGRTHGVHAEPITFGLKLALWMNEMERNLQRLKNARETVSVGKLSGTVGTYTTLDPKVEEIACKKLGIKPALVATQTLQRDRHAELAAALAVTAATIEKIATEIRALQKTECGEVEEPFKKGQKGSSAMPHKKNPIVCERLTGMARIIRANAIIAFENVTLWHERDISHSSTERTVLPDSVILLDYMLQKMVWIIDNLVVHKDAMRKNIDKSGGLIFSQRLLLALVGKGLTREKAYEIVQSNAMQARAKNLSFQDVVITDKRVSDRLSFKEINSIFDIKYYTRNIDIIYKRLGV